MGASDSYAIDDWLTDARWLYRLTNMTQVPPTGVWFDLGRSLVVNTHHELNTVLGLPCLCNRNHRPDGPLLTLIPNGTLRKTWLARLSNCHVYVQNFNRSHRPVDERMDATECPFVHPDAGAVARLRGLDSVQILNHHLDINGCNDHRLLHKKYEVMDLRRPYNAELKRGELLQGYWTGPGPQTAQCVVRPRAQRLEELRRFGLRNATFNVLACDDKSAHGNASWVHVGRRRLSASRGTDR